jgi:hypothetical protein
VKTHIIKLEPHDDAISTRDKMGWGKTGRILLVWPDRGRLLTRQLDLVLLQRHSNVLGVQLGIVTKDDEVRTKAQELAIPAFRNLRQAQNRQWRTPRRFRRSRYERASLLQSTGEQIERRDYRAERPPRQYRSPAPVARLILFTFGVLSMLSIAAVLLPSAELLLTPKVQTQTLTLDIKADPQAGSLNLAGTIPARPIAVIVEGRDQSPSSGSLSIPGQAAAGLVTFTNLTDQPVRIPTGTVVWNPDLEAARFSTTRSGEVLSGPGQTLSLPVKSIHPGSQGNLPANRLVSIEGPLGVQLAATNPEPTSGGQDRKAPAPSQTDRWRLSVRLGESLKETALNEARNQAQQDDILFIDSLTLLRTLEETYQPADSQPADFVSLNLRLEFDVLAASAADIEQLGQSVLDANLPSGFAPVENTLEVTNLTEPALGQDSIARWKLRLERQVQAVLPPDQAVKLSLGLPPEEAENRLAQALPLETRPRIALTPDWWPRLPVLPFRIAVSTP